jgi:Ca-activated chloride channel family protein
MVEYSNEGEHLSEREKNNNAPLTPPGLNSGYNDQLAIDQTSMPYEEDGTDLSPASRFKLVPVNPWIMAERDSLSTFALDVDTASYTLCRRYIRSGFLPPAGAVRMEEFINYFNYQYPQRTTPTFAVHAEVAPSPFARKDQNLSLLKIGVKARTIGRDQRKAAHLIFVVDASASMGQSDRLPLVQQALGLLVKRLSKVDRVSLITCASEARLHLEAIPARQSDSIRQAIDAIQPAGPTNLLAGLKLGYATARRSFNPKQINHVVLCSDGVANVGQTAAEAVLEEVADDRKQGITITCVGVGYGSYNDAFLEALANRGDGSYLFLDSARQAQQAFVDQLAATLQTVARDARIQVNFNPSRVRRYRLIGYENRDIEDKRFRDDTIDAGEVGSGQCSTALYELELIGQPSADRQEDLGTVFVRYRNVETGQMEEISSRMSSAIMRRCTVANAPRFFLAASAARFAEILRQSEHVKHGNLMDVFRVVEQVSMALPLDRDVRELAELIRKAEHLPRSP